MVDAQNISGIDKEATERNIDEKWENWYVKGLSDFIRVPNLSPNYDADFLTNGRIEQAIELGRANGTHLDRHFIESY